MQTKIFECMNNCKTLTEHQKLSILRKKIEENNQLKPYYRFICLF